MTRLVLTLVCLALGLGAVAARAAADPHPLLGMSWTAERGTVRDASAPPVVPDGIAIWGEAHDNPEHHRLRATWLATSKPGAVVLEQFTADQQPVLDAFLARPAAERTIPAFLAAVAWEKSGWAKYPYRPLLEAIVASGLPIYAGDPARGAIRKVAKEGLSALSLDEQRALKLDVGLGAPLDGASEAEIREAHCDLLPEAAIAPMMVAQRYRDAHLADVTLKAAERHGSVVLITGNGHARSDRGVPWYLAARRPDLALSSTLLIEVQAEVSEAEAHLPRDPGGRPAADRAVFTAPASRGDPCEAMREPGAGAAAKDRP